MPYESETIFGDEEEKDFVPNSLFYQGQSEEDRLRLLNELISKVDNIESESVKGDLFSTEDKVTNKNSINPGHQHLLLPTTPATLAANQNDYDINTDNFLRIATDASRTITGFNGGLKGRFLYVVNVGSNNLVLADQSASSVAANRIITSSGDNLTLNADEAVMLWYDSVTARWRQLGIVISIDDISDVVITSAAQGQILYHNGTNWVNLAVGTSGQFLKTQGAAANPVWADNAIQPAWTLIETLTWAASTADQSFATFTAVDELMLKISGSIVGNDNVDLRFNGDTDTNYQEYTVSGNTLATLATAQDRFHLVTNASLNTGPFVGEWHISGKTTGVVRIPIWGSCYTAVESGTAYFLKGGWTKAAEPQPANVTAMTIMVGGTTTTMKAKLYGLTY